MTDSDAVDDLVRGAVRRPMPERGLPDAHALPAETARIAGEGALHGMASSEAATSRIREPATHARRPAHTKEPR